MLASNDQHKKISSCPRPPAPAPPDSSQPLRVAPGFSSAISILPPGSSSQIAPKQAVLEEPEVVLTLASWGFSAHTGVDRDLSAPTRPAAATAGSGSVVSEISQDSFGGGGGGDNLAGDGFGGASRRGGAASSTSATIPTSVQAKVRFV